MSYRQLLTQRCEIYHMQSSENETKYGVVVTKQPKYRDVPDLINVPCYSYRAPQAQMSIVQSEPNNILDDTVHFHFLLNAGVRTNDKVVLVDETGNIEGVFTLRKPRRIKNHHIEVEAEELRNL